MTLELKTLRNGKLRFIPVKYCRVISLCSGVTFDWTNTMGGNSRFIGFAKFDAIALTPA